MFFHVLGRELFERRIFLDGEGGVGLELCDALRRAGVELLLFDDHLDALGQLRGNGNLERQVHYLSLIHI